MPKDDYPMYEGIKETMVARGMSLKAAKTHAAKITNSKGKAVPKAKKKAK